MCQWLNSHAILVKMILQFKMSRIHNIYEIREEEARAKGGCIPLHPQQINPVAYSTC